MSLHPLQFISVNDIILPSRAILQPRHVCVTENSYLPHSLTLTAAGAADAFFSPFEKFNSLIKYVAAETLGSRHSGLSLL